MKLDIIEIKDSDDGACLVKFEMDEETKDALVQYAIKHLLITEANKIIEENKKQI